MLAHLTALVRAIRPERREEGSALGGAPAVRVASVQVARP